MIRTSLLALALAITGCNGKAGDSGSAGGDGGGTGAGLTDADGDGFYAEEDDCDDANAAINPEAAEYCNSVDDNCDGLVDDDSSVDALQWYADADGDGYGDEGAEAVFACSRPTGYSSDNTDCNDDDEDFHPNAREDDCADPNDYNCDGSVGYDDADGDGWAACEDCNDASASVSPDADEVCSNAIDDDCDGLADDADPDPVIGATTWYLDADHDGFGIEDYDYADVACDQPYGFVQGPDAETDPIPFDCNDLDPSAYPGADEVCDGQDTNCNGEIDESSAVDALTWYYDGDADGFGDEDIIQLACYQPKQYLADSSDCDDSDSAIHPDADELCATSGVDDDCDGVADESTAVDVLVWYQDNDSDDYGNVAVAVDACTEPSGYTAGTAVFDCNDTDPAINPGADELCANPNIDDDCDGVADESTAVDVSTFYTDDDGDGFGDPGASLDACVQTIGLSTSGDDCDDTDPDINPDEVEVCNDGIDNNCDTSAADCALDLNGADSVFLGEGAADEAGTSLAYAGDYNGDGVGEILISANNYTDAGGDVVGATYMYMGPLSASGELSLADADVTITGTVNGDKIGKTVSGGFDINADGFDDFIISTASVNEICDTTSCLTSGSGEAGAVWVFYGSETPADADVTAADAAFVGGDSYDRAGVAALIGDVNADGYADFVVGANSAEDTESSQGLTYLVYGPASGLNNLDDGDNIFAGEASGDKSGQSVSAAGDVNGDGFDDFMTATVNTTSGSVWVIYGPASGGGSLADADVILTGESASDNAGAGIGAAGDIDGDGMDDFLIGATNEDEGGSNSGAVYLVHGPGTSGTLASASTKYLGAASNQGFGTEVDGSGDVDGDGSRDLLMSASGGGDFGEGVAYLVLGPVSDGSYAIDEVADATLQGDEVGDEVGGALLLTGDVDGSGQAAILLGASGDDASGLDAGAAYLILGIGL